jgi:hypothetical protein
MSNHKSVCEIFDLDVSLSPLEDSSFLETDSKAEASAELV